MINQWRGCAQSLEGLINQISGRVKGAVGRGGEEFSQGAVRWSSTMHIISKAPVTHRCCSVLSLGHDAGILHGPCS